MYGVDYAGMLTMNKSKPPWDNNTNKHSKGIRTAVNVILLTILIAVVVTGFFKFAEGLWNLLTMDDPIKGFDGDTIRMHCELVATEGDTDYYDCYFYGEWWRVSAKRAEGPGYEDR